MPHLYGKLRSSVFQKYTAHVAASHGASDIRSESLIVWLLGIFYVILVSKTYISSGWHISARKIITEKICTILENSTLVTELLSLNISLPLSL